jgi:hypothetical protein
VAKSTDTMTDVDLPVRRIVARRNRALRRFDNAWRDAATRSCSEEDAELAYMLAADDDPPNPTTDPNTIPPPPPPDEDEDEEGEKTETTRTVAFSFRKSEKRVTKRDGETTVRYSESSTEVMHTSSDDPPNPVTDPNDIPPPPPPEELQRLASKDPEGTHGTFLRRRDEICRRFDRFIEQAGGSPGQRRLT